MDSEIETNEQSVFTQFKKNKLLIGFLVLILALGIYLRFDDYGAEGYSGDCVNTIPAAVFVYYPHDYFPGLVSTEPPLGNYIIGLGCIASGEDFSQVKNVKPLFFPDRSAYIGKAAKNAELYCFAPVYIFGLIFLIGIIIFAFSFFDAISSVLYFIIFFTFFSSIISISRSMHVDIILFTWVIFGLTFLWLGYNSKKGSFKEKIYFPVAFAFFGLAGATKFTAGALIFFSFLLLLEKYYKDLFYFLQKGLKQLDLNLFKNRINAEDINPKSLLVNIILSIISSCFFLMLFFNFSFKNLFDTYYYMTSLNYPGVQSLGFSISIFLKWLKGFLIALNMFDFLIYFFSIFILIMIIFKKHKTPQEKFTLYLVLLCFLVITLFKSGIMTCISRTLPFMFGFFILMGLTFSNEKYSIFNLFKIKKKYFLLFIILYATVSFLTLYFAPFHHVVKNPIICSLANFGDCRKSFSGIKPLSLYLDSILNEDETFLPTGIYNFYTRRHNDDILWWMFYSNFKKQTGKEPRLGDYLKYYQPEGRRIRYIHTDTSLETNPDDMVGIGIDLDILKKNYQPHHIIKIYNKNVAYVYDLDNLVKKDSKEKII